MSTQSSAAAPSSPAKQSPWHWQSPVPYLFGGLAAMLVLIALALSILAYSYWKLSGDVENRDDDGETREIEADGSAAAPETAVVEEKYLVIMAGQENPTFLATPMTSRASSFGSKRSVTSSTSTSTTGNSLPMEEDYHEEKGVNVHIDMGNI